MFLSRFTKIVLISSPKEAYLSVGISYKESAIFLSCKKAKSSVSTPPQRSSRSSSVLAERILSSISFTSAPQAVISAAFTEASSRERGCWAFFAVLSLISDITAYALCSFSQSFLYALKVSPLPSTSSICTSPNLRSFCKALLRSASRTTRDIFS